MTEGSPALSFFVSQVLPAAVTPCLCQELQDGKLSSLIEPSILIVG